jgi:malonate decarboxylase beta subunit
MSLERRKSYYEASARIRVESLLDSGTFKEWIDPIERWMSPHGKELNTPKAFDDGIVIGEGQLNGSVVYMAAQEGAFMGGSVGEVHGAKLVGLLKRALMEKPQAVLICADSGGVRLHEANAGLIAISEVLRALLDLRKASIPSIVMIGGKSVCFGGMSIVAKCCDHVIMSEEGRLSLSGPEVIETVKGTEEYDSQDRALVWRTTGDKHRYILGEAHAFVSDAIPEFRSAAIERLSGSRPLTLERCEEQQIYLQTRLDLLKHCDDALDIWQHLGLDSRENIPMLETDSFLQCIADKRKSL